MDLLDLLKLMFRRWYVTVPVVALTLAGAFALGAQIQPEYKTEAAVLLVPPTANPAPPAPGATPRPGNPWLRVGENAMAQAVQISLSSYDARQKVQAAGGDPNYEIGLVNRSSIVTIEVTAETEASALATVQAVTELIGAEVASQQAKYRPGPGEQITTQVLDPGLNITQSRSNVLRAQIVVLAVGMLLAAVAAVLADALLRRRAAAGRRTRPAGSFPADNTGQASVTTAQRRTPTATRPIIPAGRGAPAADVRRPLPAASDEEIPADPPAQRPSGTGGADSAVDEQTQVIAGDETQTILLSAVRRPTGDDRSR